jgi:glycosyl transferase, family 25
VQLTKLAIKSRMPPIRVISLARQPERRSGFLRRNAHLSCTFLDAVDGSTLTGEQIRACGLFLPEVESTYDAHAYGVAMSHWQLWKEAAAADRPITIAEDDAIFRHDFEARSGQVLATLPPDWDFVLWGWNFDSVVCVYPMGSVSPVAMLFDESRLRASLDEFQAIASPVQAFRLERAFGLPAYTLSPRGAAKLLDLCFPQRQEPVWLPVFSRFLANIGVDVSANAAFPQTQSFACFPPIVVTPNVRGAAA